LRSNLNRACSGEGAVAGVGVREPERKALVRRGALPRAHAGPRHGGALADEICGGLRLPQALAHSMIFEKTRIAGVWVVEPERHADERGFFARTWDTKEFAEQGLNGALVQCSLSYNAARGTLRGLHYQAPPHEEAKLVRCAAGAIFDVSVDLRRDSPTFKSWFGVELSAENWRALYVGEGCAYGFLTLTDGAEVLYQISEFWASDAARGVRWDDPALEIDWPGEVLIINERDRTYPDFEAGE